MRLVFKESKEGIYGTLRKCRRPITREEISDQRDFVKAFFYGERKITKAQLNRMVKAVLAERRQRFSHFYS